MTCPRCGTETNSWPCPVCGFPETRFLKKKKTYRRKKCPKAAVGAKE